MQMWAARVVPGDHAFPHTRIPDLLYPFCLAVASSFWMIQRFVQSTVRDGLHSSLRESQVAIANIHAKGDLQNSRFLKIAGENSALKAGMQLLLAEPAQRRGAQHGRRPIARTWRAHGL